MSWAKALEIYARTAPDTISKDVLLRFMDDTITIRDAYRKAMYHYLILPRLPSSLVSNPSQISSLKCLLSGDKEEALHVLQVLGKEAEVAKTDILEDMQKKHGFQWTVNIGFHAVPSMEHIHLHVVSSDLLSSALKNKKHYNSFSPKLGFFIHLSDVLSWLTEGASDSRLNINSAKYEPLLKTDLSCFKCDESFKRMPRLKEHLEDEWKKEKRHAVKENARKRQRGADGGEDMERAAKKHIGEKEVASLADGQ
ncbi:HIT-like protein [Dacryopinax primogenitus]|uniref:HIT-like protein n=1 Tax=Dacryopinax primogenitus (strain DJM 731) TaxID=1858805 RepID=M5GAW9_DACPD|nr:HIT-like protein [Dacryopinax primogenitus]EJU05530.1 HIT-like protein [Dacryopinax primogenitus]